MWNCRRLSYQAPTQKSYPAISNKFSLPKKNFATRCATKSSTFERQKNSFSTPKAHTNEPPSLLKCCHDATDLLPHQGILENFVHHNPLSHLEDMHFKDALLHAQELEAYMSPSERTFHILQIDPRKRVNEAISDICSSFLDRGAAKWVPNTRDRGFLYFFASLEGLGIPPWRTHARTSAKKILQRFEEGQTAENIAEDILKENLEAFGVVPEEYTLCIRSMLLEIRGWAGMFYRMETHPEEAPPETCVRLIEFAAVKSIFVRSSIESLAGKTGRDTTHLATWLNKAPKYRPENHESDLHASAIASVDQSSERREALEVQFEHTLLQAIESSKAMENRPSLQMYTCIDDRECSIRRHVEETNPNEIETFGVAGFFGIPIKYKPLDASEPMVLAPEGQHPTAVLIEAKSKWDQHSLTWWNMRRKIVAYMSLAYEKASFSAIGSLGISLFAPISLAKLALVGFFPESKHKMEALFHKWILEKPLTDFQLPFPPEQAASMLSRTFHDIGTQNRFAPVIIVLGHGAISANNPYVAAYNCGACAGHEGGPNARLLARLANNMEVRHFLKQNHNVEIPDDTIFVGGMHNTTKDTVEFYDMEKIPDTHQERFQNARKIIDDALCRNALERCNRFLLAENVHSADEALKHVHSRAVDLAEVRPELNHATNAGVVVGRRGLTKSHSLGRRVFLPSYDPYSDDDIGTNLEHVLAPALVVCSGINLEYLFSTISGDRHGSGTKAPMNVVSNIGVIQGTSGDLRTGLPTQMTEMHVPVRALYVIDSPLDRVKKVLTRRPDLSKLVTNEWVRFFVRDPETGIYYKKVKGDYLAVDPDPDNTMDFFTQHRTHGLRVAHRESFIYYSAMAGMIASCIFPIAYFGTQYEPLNPHGMAIAACATLLSLPVLAFSRRYLHGEYMFARFEALCVGLLLGFNLVAMAPTLEHAMIGWSLFGFASTFLIGAYNNRPTVRNNATFAFAAYRISDFALLVAATLANHNKTLTAMALMLAALFKSSQFPLASLFVRSMEGPTPASALGYAGLSAHVGLVLLTSTMPYWYDLPWARFVVGGLGVFTAIHSTFISKVRSDRKGALASATSATIGVIMLILALGHPHIALGLALGHAAFRILQVLRSPNIITENQSLRNALGYIPSPIVVPEWLFKLAWSVRRYDADFHLINILHRISPKVNFRKPLTKVQQWLLTTVCVVLAGAPFTPFAEHLDEIVADLLFDHPFVAFSIMIAHFGISVFLIRFLLVNVLDTKRFQRAPNAKVMAFFDSLFDKKTKAKAKAAAKEIQS